jgi:predicted nucleotidyltransferase
MFKMKERVEEIILKKLNSNVEILNIYLFGSRVHECETKDSDFDFVCIVKEEKNTLGLETIEIDNLNINIYTVYHFDLLIQQNTIWMTMVTF